MSRVRSTDVRCLLAAPVLLLGGTLVQARTAITLGESSGAAGQSRVVPVYFETTDEVAALQLDIAHLRSTLGAPVPGDAAAGHLLDAERVQGKLRTVVYSEDNSALASGTLLEIPVDFTAAVEETARSLSLSNALLSNASGESIEAFLLPFGRITRPLSEVAHPDAFLTGLEIGAIALDTDGEVSSVEFLVNGQSIGLSTKAPYTLHWHPLAEGEYVISALVTDSDGHASELTPKSISVSLLSSYQEWTETYFGEDAADPAIAGLRSDPNGNGLINAFEFALGRNPKIHTAEGLPLPDVMNIGGAEYLALTYRVPIGIEGVSYRVEFSEDLHTWHSGEGYTVEEPSVETGLVKAVTVRAARPIDLSQKRGFLRLVVDLE